MRQSTFVKLALVCFLLIFATFIVRGTTRLIIGDRMSMLLSLPLGLIALSLLVALVGIALLNAFKIRPLDPDLEE